MKSSVATRRIRTFDEIFSNIKLFEDPKNKILLDKFKEFIFGLYHRHTQSKINIALKGSVVYQRDQSSLASSDVDLEITVPQLSQINNIEEFLVNFFNFNLDNLSQDDDVKPVLNRWAYRFKYIDDSLGEIKIYGFRRGNELVTLSLSCGDIFEISMSDSLSIIPKDGWTSNIDAKRLVLIGQDQFELRYCEGFKKYCSQNNISKVGRDDVIVNFSTNNLLKRLALLSIKVPIDPKKIAGCFKQQDQIGPDLFFREFSLFRHQVSYYPVIITDILSDFVAKHLIKTELIGQFIDNLVQISSYGSGHDRQILRYPFVDDLQRFRMGSQRPKFLSLDFMMSDMENKLVALRALLMKPFTSEPFLADDEVNIAQLKVDISYIRSSVELRLGVIIDDEIEQIQREVEAMRLSIQDHNKVLESENESENEAKGPVDPVLVGGVGVEGPLTKKKHKKHKKKKKKKPEQDNFELAEIGQNYGLVDEEKLLCQDGNFLVQTSILNIIIFKKYCLEKGFIGNDNISKGLMVLHFEFLVSKLDAIKKSETETKHDPFIFAVSLKQYDLALILFENNVKIDRSYNIRDSELYFNEYLILLKDLYVGKSDAESDQGLLINSPQNRLNNALNISALYILARDLSEEALVLSKEIVEKMDLDVFKKIVTDSLAYIKDENSFGNLLSQAIVNKDFLQILVKKDPKIILQAPIIKQLSGPYNIATLTKDSIFVTLFQSRSFEIIKGAIDDGSLHLFDKVSRKQSLEDYLLGFISQEREEEDQAFAYKIRHYFYEKNKQEGDIEKIIYEKNKDVKSVTILDSGFDNIAKYFKGDEKVLSMFEIFKTNIGFVYEEDRFTLDILQFLINMNYKNNFGDFRDIYEKLSLDPRVNIECKTKDGLTVLYHAIRSHEYNLAKILLERGAKIYDHIGDLHMLLYLSQNHFPGRELVDKFFVERDYDLPLYDEAVAWCCDMYHRPVDEGSSDQFIDNFGNAKLLDMILKKFRDSPEREKILYSESYFHKEEKVGCKTPNFCKAFFQLNYKALAVFIENGFDLSKTFSSAKIPYEVYMQSLQKDYPDKYSQAVKFVKSYQQACINHAQEQLLLLDENPNPNSRVKVKAAKAQLDSMIKVGKSASI